MIIDKIVEKYGSVIALKLLGFSKLANELDKANNYTKTVLNTSKIRCWDDRDTDTKKRLSIANDIKSKAYKVLFENRAKDV